MPSQTASNEDFLSRMAAASSARLAAAQANTIEPVLRGSLRDLPPPVPFNLSPEGFDLIAEVKRRSPSAGQLAGDELDPVQQAGAYARGGAAALSVLTEPDQFSGSLDDLKAVSREVPALPSMRKDFLVDAYQVLEARAARASGVLLIAAILSADELKRLLEAALGLDLFALVEAFDERDLDACLPVMQQFGPATEADRVRLAIGINCRDLRTLDVEFARFAALAPALPTEMPRVAESGITNASEAAEVARLGYNLALVGTALMRSGDPVAAASDLLRAGRN